MPLSKLNTRAVIGAYVEAYLGAADWDAFLEEDLKNFMNKTAKTLNSRMDILMVSLLGTAAAVLGDNTVIELSDTQKMHTNVYLVIVAASGLGKTPIFHQICDKALKYAEAAKGIRFVVDNFTRKGLLSSLQRNDGFGFICEDDFCQSFGAMLKGSKKEVGPFRTSLNKFFSGGSICKDRDYASKKTLLINKSCLSILGFTQPGPFVEFYRSLISIEDGLADRFLSFSVPVRHRSALAENYVPPIGIGDKWCERMFLQMYEDHNIRNGPKRYKLSDDALAHYTNISEASKVEMLESYRELEKKVAAGEPTSSQYIPKDQNGSKDMELSLKLACILNIVLIYLRRVVSGSADEYEIQQEIPLSVLQMAIDLVSSSRMQAKEYAKIEAQNRLW